MAKLFALDTDVVSAWSAVATAGGTVVAATAAVAAAVAAIRTLRASKRDSRDRSRPMIGALLVRDAHPTSRTAELVVRNYGQSIAYNVELFFDPPIVDKGTATGKNSFVPFLIRRYEKPIPNMMPGVELRSIWFTPGQEINGVIRNDEPIPEMVELTIRYSDRPNFWSRHSNRYRELFVLDLSLIRGDVISTHSDDHLGLHKRSTQALEKVAPALQQVAKDLHRIEDYVKPAEVRAYEDEQDAARARLIEERRKERSIRLENRRV